MHFGAYHAPRGEGAVRPGGGSVRVLIPHTPAHFVEGNCCSRVVFAVCRKLKLIPKAFLAAGCRNDGGSRQDQRPIRKHNKCVVRFEAHLAEHIAGRPDTRRFCAAQIAHRVVIKDSPANFQFVPSLAIGIVKTNSLEGDYRDLVVGSRLPVKTGLDGFYDFTLEWAPETTEYDPAATLPSSYAAIEQQLGLKLQPKKPPIEFLVIDHAEKPTGNQ